MSYNLSTKSDPQNFSVKFEDVQYIETGEGGEAYVYIPAVSPDGIISWTNTGGLPNPEPVDIKGKDGEDGVGVPIGGETGQVLVKKSNADYDTIWATPEASQGDKNFIFKQKVSQNVWSIEHNLNKFPSVTVVDSGNNVVVGDVFYVDENNLTITFSSEFAGIVYLN